MKDAKQRWSDEMKESTDALKTIRDELKVQMHLASMDARTRFAAMERRLDNEQLNIHKTLSELLAGFRALKDELAKAARGGRPSKHA
ncbi:MAG: hypothetical protein H6Q89_1542 [Myxococcaceae bacterium]|nr:hypothetical protein [Myxococcaceae bacterium]